MTRTNSCKPSFLQHDSPYQIPSHSLSLSSTMMKITIVMKCCKFSMDVATHEPILQIKRRIQTCLGIPSDSQTLTVCDWELVDGLDLDDYPLITDGTDIHLSTTFAPPVSSLAATMKITVKFSARKLEIEVDKTDTVRSLKEKIHIVDGSPMRRMTLFFNGTEMEDDFRSLNEYGMEEGSEIVVFLKTMSRVLAEPPSRRVAVVVQTSSSLMNGARFPVEMKDTSSVVELRQFLIERRSLPIDDYIFIHKQRIMRDEFSLRWHGVENGDFLYVFKGTVSRGSNIV